MDLVTTINHSIALVTRLREISKNISEAEFRNVLADLSNELGDAKLEIAALKEQLARVNEEYRQLKAAVPEKKQKPKLKWGCYQFEGEEGLYCTACYDVKGLKVITSRMNSNYRSCPVCKSVFGS
jgi:hypothetical protein